MIRGTITEDRGMQIAITGLDQKRNPELEFKSGDFGIYRKRKG
jgi:hypothetical protein